MKDLTGKQFGPYHIVAPLGEGGMAAVYKAYHPSMERHVALKVLPRHFAEDPEFIARFEREVKAMAQLQHPHIVPVFDYGQSEGYTYIAMPLIGCGTLADSLKGKPLPLARIRQVIAQVGDALSYAHAHGLIHRDVKPGNVLIDEEGNCLLTDFGLARLAEATVSLTTTGTILGTPAYMSPEQGSGKRVDLRSDVYALGIILYQMATGRVPYQAETPVAVIMKHLRAPLPPARALNPDLPEAVQRVILKALSKNPKDRYPSAGEMVRAIQTAIPARAAGTPNKSMRIRAGAVAATASAAEPPRRAPSTWVWSLAAAATLAIAGGLFTVFGRGSKPIKLRTLATAPSNTPSQAAMPTPRPPALQSAPTVAASQKLAADALPSVAPSQGPAPVSTQKSRFAATRHVSQAASGARADIPNGPGWMIDSCHYAFNNDGTCIATSGSWKMKGSWRVERDKFVATWNNGFVDTYDIPGKDSTYAGLNQGGRKLTLRKMESKED